MTNEERDIITRFIERVGGASTGGLGSGSGAASALPPIDKEADALIGELLAKYPEARYRLTQTAFVQEHALAEAQNRIKRLEWELEQTKQSAQQAQQQQPRSGGFLSGLFGGGQQQAPQTGQGPWNQPGPQYGQASAPPPPPQYAPGYQPGLFQRSGSGFLGSALTTAAGVAGGAGAGHCPPLGPDAGQLLGGPGAHHLLPAGASLPGLCRVPGVSRHDPELQALHQSPAPGADEDPSGKEK